MRRVGRRLAAVVLGARGHRLGLAGLLVLVALVPATGRDRPDSLQALAPIEEVAAGFREPIGVAVDEAGAIYLSDRKAGTVTRLSPTGSAHILVRRLDEPVGLALDRDGALLIAEEGEHRLLRRAPSGALGVLVSGIRHPRWLAVAEDGGVYISARGWRGERGHHDEDDDEDEGQVILRLGPDGVLSLVADGFKGLEGLAVHGQSLYAASRRRHGESSRHGSNLVRFPILPDGRLGPMEVLVRGQLRQPIGLAVDALGGVFITADRLRGGHERDDDERHHGREDDDDDTTGIVLKWRPDGRLVIFASGLEEPGGLAFEAPGHLLAAEERRLLRFHAPDPPAVSVPAFTNQAVLPVEGTTESRARVDLFLNGAAQPLTATADAAGHFSIPVPLAPGSENALVIFATAHGGDGLSSAPAEARVTHDGIGPSVVFLDPPAGAFVRGTVPVRARASDGASGVASLELRADGQVLTATLDPSPPAPSVTATASWNTTTVPDGSRPLTAVATDQAGNGQVATRLVIVDNTPPDTEVTGGPGGAISQTSATFTFAGTDNLTAPGDLRFAWRLDGGAFTDFSAGTTATVTGLAPGPHTFEAKALDLADNEDPTPATRAFEVRAGPAIARVDPDSGTIGALVTIHGGGFAPGDTQVSFNGVAATVRTITATTITTTVPPGATSGPLAVSTSQGTAVHPFTVLTTQDFVIAVAPADGHVLQGAATAYTLELVSIGVTPFTGLATLSVEGLPTGVAPTFGSPTLTGGQRGTLTLAASGTAPVGTSAFTVRATAPGETGTLVRSATANVRVLAGGRTALVGQVTFVDGRPIPGVMLKLDPMTPTPLPVFTDAGGNFTILDAPEGTFMLGIDANVAQLGLPIYGVDVVLTAGQVTQVPPFRITPPPPPERFTAINNAAAAQVVTDARFPGASITLPAGARIVGWDGELKNRIAIERLTPEQLPVPPPPGPTRSLYQIFFGTPMGGLPSVPLPVTLPNDQEAAPGEQVEIWYYDAAPLGGMPAAWRLAGAGSVSEDGSRIVSNPGVGLQRFCGVCGLFCFIRQQGGQPNQNPGGPEGGDPVNLGLGQVIVEKMDLVLPGKVPAMIHRTYNPFDPLAGIAGLQYGLGLGWALSIEVVLQEETSTLRRLILPGNARFAFVLQPDGTFVNSTHARFAGAVLSETFGVHRLRFKDGTVWRFAPSFVSGISLLAEQADRNGNRLTIERSFGRLTRLVDSAGRALTFTFDPSGRIAEVEDPLGRTVRYGYSGQRLESVTDLAGGVTRYTYRPDGKLLTIVDPRGETFLSHEYDTQGRVLRQTQADGGVWTFAYEGPAGAHTRVSVTDPLGKTTIHRMNNGGFASEVVDGLGQVTREERDARGLVSATLDPLGRTTRFEYDAAGNATRIIDPAGQEQTFTYEPTFSQVASIVDQLDQETRFEYDALGNLTATVDPAGARTTLAYNAAGQAVSTTDPLGNTTRFEYDAAGNLTAIVDPLGKAARRQYDAASRLVRQTDARGRHTTFAYDGMNRLTRIVDPTSRITQFAYDASGNLLTVTDPLGRTTTLGYDAMDRVATRTDALGVMERFEYDRLGNLIRHVDRQGRATTFTYDALSRRTAVSYADGTTVRFVPDAVGRLVQAVDPVAGTIVNTYDVLDRLVAQTTPLGRVSYQYDALGRRVRMDAPGQTPVGYGYDVASRLSQVTQGAQVVGLEHDTAGRRTRLTLPNGVSTDYRFDAASRVTGLVYRNGGGPLGDLTYQYDAAGNRIRVGGTFARTLLPEPRPSATYDAANRQRTFGDETLAFDPNGQLTSITGPAGVTTVTWDARNRLTALAGPDGTATFEYDVLGRRIAKTVNGSTTRYLYDDVDVVQEIVDGRPATYLRTLAIDEPLVRDGSEFYLADALGSVVGLTDPTGALATGYSYEPFGLARLEGLASSNPFQFTGRENDELRFYAYRARYYDPLAHRFVSEDPIDLAELILMRQAEPEVTALRLLYLSLQSDASQHPYAYARNSPLVYTDPSGEIIPQVILGCLIGGGISVGLDLLTGEKIDWTNAAIGCALGALGGLSGPKGPLFGRGRYRGGDPGIFNRGNFRTGWSWDAARGRNMFGVHGGTPGTAGHWHATPIPGPRGPLW